MQKIKVGTAVALLALSLFSSSCSKDDETLKKAKNEPATGPNATAIIESREETPSLFGHAKVVPRQVALSLAERINAAVPAAMRVGAVTSLRTVDSLFTISDSLGVPMLYIANYADDGFVVISADERRNPICAVVEQAKYGPSDAPSMLLEWFDITVESVKYAKSGLSTVANLAEMEWVKVIKSIGQTEYLVIDDCCEECPNYPDCRFIPSMGCGDPEIDCGNVSGDPCGSYTVTSKGPLMTTRWGQRCTFNELCPDKNCDVCFSNENALTGCVATAMAQVLRYWAHPCSQAYDYATMPNISGNGEVQRMMRDAGDAVDMDYGCGSSGADGNDTDNAFENDFCFGSAERGNYNSGSYQTVINNLNGGLPVLLDGCRTRKGVWPIYIIDNCHMWVCDGYERFQNNCYSILHFHMNWGWLGQYNGWYDYNSWSPGSSNYQYAQDITYNIEP
jgi:hypothetical protein